MIRSRRAIPTRNRIRRGFTLLELIVVIIMMAVVAGLVVPRLGGSERRRQDVTVQRVADLLSIAAYRDAIGGRHVGVRFDDETATLTLMVRELGERDWRPDPVTPAVDLGTLEIAELGVGTGTVRGSREPWWITFPQGEARPDVAMKLTPTRDQRSTLEWVVRLPSFATAASVQRPGEPVPVGADAIDLDAAGLEDVAW
ncbi:MAG: prepilin-type N-terminal cleavage/methylation domain-containing protein [Phycisphaerales bacterium]|nr:prepilin-type N-terminal cleavage/methylation domain-containing protein [Phycisphaerales bacterium]